MNGPAQPRSLVPAAQYLRMSDEHQRYSIANQTAAIARYAEQRGFEIVQTYADEGRTGLRRKGCRALNALLDDVRAKAFQFKALLILDVSRWGRYQNYDESAAYEFMCWEAGIDVRFCVEPFENDGSPGSSIVKHIKRIMAGEYVRELSDRLRRAKKLQAQLGHHTGSAVVFGIRRELITHEGKARQILQAGERKAITTDRIRLVLGPTEEIATVREIFRLFVRRRLSHEAIARRLLKEERPHPAAGPWTGAKVRRVLLDEIYTGVVFYGKTWQYLKSPPKRTARSSWIKVQELPPIVPKRLFNEAKAIFDATTARLSNDDIAERLRRCLAEHGRLTASILIRCPYTPSIHTLDRRFGGLNAAYAYIGYEPSKYAKNRGRGGTRWNEAAALAKLQDLHAEHGFISGLLINSTRGVPSAKAYRIHFGSLLTAYARAGLDTPLDRCDYVRAGARRAGRGVNGRASNVRPPRKPSVLRNQGGARFTNEELVGFLRRLLEEQGYLNECMIQLDHTIPTATYFRKRFGTLLAAYGLAGYVSTQTEVLRLAAARRSVQVAEMGDRPV
jgi:DNA invertase Pin-like site-specific DNA recombinase